MNKWDALQLWRTGGLKAEPMFDSSVRARDSLSARHIAGFFFNGAVMYIA